jgi:hypothetical protein
MHTFLQKKDYGFWQQHKQILQRFCNCCWTSIPLIPRQNSYLHYVELQINMLNAQLVEAETLTQDVMHDLHSVKLDISNYAVRAPLL